MNLSSLLSKDLILLDFRTKEHTEALQEEDVESIFEEVKMKDRQKLDSLVLEAIGLDPKRYLKPFFITASVNW